MSYAAHAFIPAEFGALGIAIGFAPVFWLRATTLMGGSAINA